MFFNSASGAKLAASELSALTQTALDAGLEVHEVIPEADIASVIHERLRLGRCLIVAAGGDGTIHHVLQSVVNNPNATLAVIPIGTYNHFARDLGIPTEWRAPPALPPHGETVGVATPPVNAPFFAMNQAVGP